MKTPAGAGVSKLNWWVLVHRRFTHLEAEALKALGSREARGTRHERHSKITLGSFRRKRKIFEDLFCLQTQKGQGGMMRTHQRHNRREDGRGRLDDSRYVIGLHCGILSAKHRQAIGSAVWVYMWLIRKQTENEKGLVCGGHGVTGSEIAHDLGMKVETVRRHLRRLQAGGYVRLLGEAGAPNRIRINKPSKRFYPESDPLQKSSGTHYKNVVTPLQKSSTHHYKRVKRVKERDPSSFSPQDNSNKWDKVRDIAKANGFPNFGKNTNFAHLSAYERGPYLRVMEMSEEDLTYGFKCLAALRHQLNQTGDALKFFPTKFESLVQKMEGFINARSQGH